jgi:AraC family transcriptional activator of pobA
VDRLDEGVVVQVLPIENFSIDVPREPHRHDYHELIWVSEGEGEHLIDGAVVPVVPGTVTVIGRAQVHQFRRVRNLSGAVLRFQDEAVDGSAGNVGGRWLLACRGTRTIRVPDGACDQVGGLIAALTAEAGAKPDEYTAGVQRHLVSTLLLWLERWFDAQQDELAQGEDGDAPLHRRFVELLEHDYAHHHDAAYYADALGVPQAALSRALSNITGMSTKELVLDRVLLEATRLLRFTDLTIGAIAHRVGYHDPLYFSRAFKRSAGESPQAYRDSVRGKSMHPRGSAIGAGG